MWNELISFYFWFSPPPTSLTQSDKLLAAIFLGLVAIAVICRVAMFFIKNPVYRKLLRRVWHMGLTIGLIGAVWAGIRYENTPLFGKRAWAGIDLIIGLIWFGWILKYVVFAFRSEKTDYEKELIKSKYLPKSR